MTLDLLPQQPVIRLEPNRKGRDLVVGDIHGCFHYLDEALRQAQFNPDIDRLISVGDLIDRGPENMRAVEFLQKPWFFAVRGNHDQYLLNAWCGNQDEQWWRQQGGNWFFELSEDDRYTIARALSDLPFAFEIATDEGLIGIIHAEVPIGQDWQTFIDRLNEKDWDTMMACIRQRDRFRGYEETVEGVRHIISGHSTYPEINRLANQIFIDTGAVYRHMAEENPRVYKPKFEGGITLCDLEGNKIASF